MPVARTGGAELVIGNRVMPRARDRDSSLHVLSSQVTALSRGNPWFAGWVARARPATDDGSDLFAIFSHRPRTDQRGEPSREELLSARSRRWLSNSTPTDDLLPEPGLKSGMRTHEWIWLETYSA